jgi:hypothetical protein
MFSRVFGEDLAVLFVLAIMTMGFIFYELAGLTLPGWHTISWFSHHHMYLRVVILIAFALTVPWWWLHSGSDIPR